LVEEIERDLAKGNAPCAIVGMAGTTSTGVIDPLDELARIAARYKIWFHVDAAYGGALVFSEKHKSLLRGLERADSVTIDPHKWMFVPFACGAILVRDGAQVLRRSFDASPEYLSERRESMGGADTEYDLFRYGQLGTRRANSLKLWMCLKFLGARGYAEIIDRQIELTHRLASRIDASPNFERAGEVETAVCCFRFTPERLRGGGESERNELQQALQQRIEQNGEAWFASTVIKGERALRVNVNSYLTRERHIDYLVELLEREGAQLLAEKSGGAKERGD
nr:aminotransferase class V-fold PLP-dependent enzyme [Pyrinomonadaceae bacterium]